MAHRNSNLILTPPLPHLRLSLHEPPTHRHSFSQASPPTAPPRAAAPSRKYLRPPVLHKRCRPPLLHAEAASLRDAAPPCLHTRSRELCLPPPGRGEGASTAPRGSPVAVVVEAPTIATATGLAMHAVVLGSTARHTDTIVLPCLGRCIGTTTVRGTTRHD